MNEKLEKYRKQGGLFGTSKGDDHGLFFIPIIKSKIPLKALCAPMNSEWQHVSVSLPNRCPTWQEMCLVKNLFWGEDIEVIQFHPAKKDYVNNHPFCLHLWRHRDGHKLPPSLLVGVKECEE